MKIMKTKTLKESIMLKATPHEVFEMIMDSKKHSEITGSKAVISRKVGGKFSVYDGDLYGTNVEIIPDRKIVQKWRIREWKPLEHYSTLTFEIEETRNGTRLIMTHKGVPEYDFQGIKMGWEEDYFEPMKTMIA